MTRPYKALSRLLLTGILMGAIGGLVEAKPKKTTAKAVAPAVKSAAVTSIQTPKPAYKPTPLALTKPVVGQAVAFGETPAVSSLSAHEGWSVDQSLVREREEINELNSQDLFTPNPNSKPQSDGALSSWSPNRGFQLDIPTPSLTFEGIDSTDNIAVLGTTFAPPDTEGTAGPNHYVQTVNTLNRVFDKATGNPLTPPFRLSSLFASVGGICSNTDNGDTIVVYDRMANRWLISQFAFTSSSTPPFHQCIAVSKNGDPTGAYWAYDFVVPGNDFNDYFKFGAWPDGYYMTDRQFTAPSGSYNGFGVVAFDRAKMLVGDRTASFIYFNAGPLLSDASSGMIPTDFNGITPPPAGAPNVFAVFTDDAYLPNSFDTADTLRLFNFHADFATPSNSTFLERPESPLVVAQFDSRVPDTSSGSPVNRARIEQPPPATAADYLDAIGDRLMLRFQYINRGGVELMTTVHTVNAGEIPAPGLSPTVAQYKAGTRYYVLRKTTPAGAFSVIDQATATNPFDSLERWMGSSALDNAGNLAVGYSVSSTTKSPSLFYSGKLATDPPGQLTQGETSMFDGTGVQRGSGNRWGDYSNMSLDPSDDATFWYTNEYYTTTNQTFNWQTRIGKFKYASTTAPAQGTLAGTVTACDTGLPLADALVQVTGGPSTGFSSATKPDGTYSFNLSPGTYTVTISDPAHNCAGVGPFTDIITNGATTTQNACLSGIARFAFQSVAVSPTGGDGNGAFDASECNTLNVTILNDGCLLGQNITGVLSSNTPGVTVTQPNSAYPNTPEGATSTNTTPFQVSTSNTFACGTVINFTLTLTSSSGSNTVSFSLPTCLAAPQTQSGALDSSDQTMSGRLGRNGVSSACGAAKACPGLFGAPASRRFRTFNFTNGPTTACATITTTASCPTATNPIIAVAYLNSYDPNNICTNYLGDPGGSNTTTSFQVNVPASQTLVVVVEEANSLTGCSGYSVQVSGLVGNNIGPGACTTSAGAPLQVNSAVSRKLHTGVGTFSIPMPLAGPTGVEDRTNTTGYDIVATFNGPVGAGSAAVTSGTATISSITFSGNDMIVHLSGTTDAELVTLQLQNVTSAVPLGGGNGVLTSYDLHLGFLVGDSNNSRAVNAGDTIQVQSRSGQPVDSTNFRSDVNADGSINAGDTIIVQSKSGNGIP